MPLGTQARLLRVLETGEFIRVGSSKVQKTDVRVIAATNKDLLESVTQWKVQTRSVLSFKHSSDQGACIKRQERGRYSFVQKICG